MPTEDRKVRTMDVLADLGFLPTDDRGDPSCKLRVANIDLRATECLTLRAVRAVIISGVLSTSRSIGQIEIQLPTSVDNAAEVSALIAIQLRYQTRGEIPDSVWPDWVHVGLIDAPLLVPDLCRKIARDLVLVQPEPDPYCSVVRRFAWAMLAEWSSALADLGPGEFVRLKFDGRVLTVVAGEHEIEVVASGKPWEAIYCIERRGIHRLPKRPSGDPVRIRVSSSGLQIGNRICGKFRVLREDDLLEVCECERAAATAFAALRAGPTLHTFEDKSHFTSEITSCRSCGRPALELWHERINFHGGEDDHTTEIVLLDEDEAQAMIDKADWRKSLQSLNDRPILWEIWPDRRKHPGPRWSMYSGRGVTSYLGWGARHPAEGT